MTDEEKRSIEPAEEAEEKRAGVSEKNGGAERPAQQVKKTDDPAVRIKNWRMTQRIRMVIQLVFIVVFPSAFASAFAAVKEIAAEFSEGAELAFTPFAKMLVFLLVFTIVFGRFFCGYACAFGTLGDWVWQASRFVQSKTGRKLPELPEKMVHYLQFVKYIVLAAVFAMCYFGMSADVSRNSPWTFFSRLVSLKLPGSDLIAGGIVLLIIMAGMALQSRFFCQFLCPMGAVFSLMPVLPTGQLVRDSENCIKCCRICRRGCPAYLKLGKEELRDGECIRCNRCISLCPRGNIGLSRFPVRASSPAWVIFQAALLLAVLKFVL